MMNRYPDLIKKVICQYAALDRAMGDVQSETVFNDDTGHYELILLGWEGWRRVHASLIHIDIRGNKIWIQHDGTEDGVANELVAAGVPKNDIVLAFHPPSERKHTEFAVA